MSQAAAVSEIQIQHDVAPVQVLRELRLRDFRNFAELELRFPAAGVLVVGENGSGKTNLLEAIWYLEVFRSLRGARDEQLVRFGADGFHLRGRFETAAGRSTEVSVGYDARTRRKRVLVDGAEVERLGDAIGHAGVVVFSPADVALVSGGPGERRHFLDIVLCLNRRGYMDALQRFRHALRQRNSLLRQGAAQALIDAYEPGLVEPAAIVMEARAGWVAEHASMFERRTMEVGGRASRMRYRPGVKLDDEGALSDRARIVEAMREALARNALRERERGVTMAGPHRDDLEIVLESTDGDLDLREYGSGGQQRTAAVALRMIEAQTVREARGVEPLVLLDDVFAEFDALRSARILELMSDGHDAQAIFTAPKQSDVHGRAASLEHWTIAGGVVTR
jgi:DNA replication and repair protein RecF